MIVTARPPPLPPHPDQQLMGDGKPVLLNQLTDDPRVPFREWVAKEGIVA